LKPKRTKSALIKLIATYVVVGGMVFIFLFDIVAVLLRNRLEQRFPVMPETFEGHGELTRFHFLNTYNSDCILIESHGRFALVDSGWGSNNPIEAVRRPGTEQRVLDYLHRVVANEEGVIYLDFVLATHFHYDHVGGFPAILSDPAVQVGRVYIPPRPYEDAVNWYIHDNRERMKNAALARGFTVVEDLPDEAFDLGNMSVQFLNTTYSPLRVENDNSIVVLAEYSGFRALLTSDIYAFRGLERDIARQVGPVDLLKLPHHGYTLSSSAYFLRALRPSLAIVTNFAGRVYPNVMWNLTFLSRTSYLSTVTENGIIVTIAEHQQMLVTGNLHLS